MMTLPFAAVPDHNFVFKTLHFLLAWELLSLGWHPPLSCAFSELAAFLLMDLKNEWIEAKKPLLLEILGDFFKTLLHRQKSSVIASQIAAGLSERRHYSYKEHNDHGSRRLLEKTSVANVSGSLCWHKHEEGQLACVESHAETLWQEIFPAWWTRSYPGQISLREGHVLGLVKFLNWVWLNLCTRFGLTHVLGLVELRCSVWLWEVVEHLWAITCIHL